MNRRLFSAVLAVTAGLPALSHAQTRVIVSPVPLGAILVAPIGAALPITTGLSGSPALRLPAIGLTPTITPLAVLTNARVSVAPLALPAAAGKLATAKAGAAAQAVTARGSLNTLATTVAPKNASASPASVSEGLQRFFDSGAAAAAHEPGAMMFSAAYLDPRVNTALQTLSRTAVGLSVYREIYNKYGGTLQLRVDSDPNASYDSRILWEGQTPVIQLTDTLVRRESPEFVASFIAREMAQLYYGSFPESVERDYLAHSVMARSYAEMTGSDVRGWWDTRRDRWQNGRYAMQSYYASWKEAVTDYYGRGGRIQDSPFFRFLKGNKQKTLEQLYNSGSISPSTYREMTSYFQQIAQSEADWIRGR